MRIPSWRLLALVVLFALVGAACTAGEDDADDAATEDPTAEEGDGEDIAVGGDEGGSLLDTVRDRGNLICGVNDAVPGFGFTDEEGNFSGFDIDFCRVVAAAVLGDAEAVEYVPLTAEQRFTSLQSGDIDVLIRNTTWTASRDGGEGAQFATITFYDGAGMMVRSDAGISSLEDLAGSPVCVLSGTTTELALAQEMGARNIDYEPVPFEDNDTLQEAFVEGRCDGWTSDKSQLAGRRSAFPDGPEALTILDVTLSKEPLGPAVRQGDTGWYDAVNWAVISTIQAEEFGITSDNVEEMQTSEDPGILAFLGQPVPPDDAVLDPGIGLDPDFAVNVISQVGNYAEIYDAHVGPDTPLGLERGPNALWTEGGLLYPPPYR